MNKQSEIFPCTRTHVQGYGFIGHSFTAMRASADKAAFHRCTFDSWQDTLYAHAHRQYYRDSTILGTIDSATMRQRSSHAHLLPKSPRPLGTGGARHWPKHWVLLPELHLRRHPRSLKPTLGSTAQWLSTLANNS